MTKAKMRLIHKWVKWLGFSFNAIFALIIVSFQPDGMGWYLFGDFVLYLIILIVPDKILWDAINKVNHIEPVPGPRMSIDDAEAGLRNMKSRNKKTPA